MPPAQPMNSWPSSSESRLMRIFPLKKPFSKPKAPSMPVSSEMVNRHSSLPMGSFPARRARQAATPMPSSAPRVVSLAIIQPSSTTYWMGWVLKSKFTPGFFSQTMSWWACRTSVGTFSLPLAASLVMSTLPVLSVLQERLCLTANCCKYSIIGPSCPDSRGMRVISLKYSNTVVAFISISFFHFVNIMKN